MIAMSPGLPTHPPGEALASNFFPESSKEKHFRVFHDRNFTFVYYSFRAIRNRFF